MESVFACIIWGLSPLYWLLLESVSPWIIVANRIIWACVMMFIIILFRKELPSIKPIFREAKGIATIIICACLILSNWSIYIWAINHQLVIDASLAGYIRPLMVILFSKIFFGEQFDLLKKISILIAVIGIAVMIFLYGSIPYVSLSLAITFSVYGLLKKKVKYTPVQTMFMETLFLFIPAVLFLFFFPSPAGTFKFSNWILFAIGGVVTGLPLFLFASGVKKTKLSTQGYLQFILPTIFFFLSDYILHEKISNAEFVGLYFFWAACIIFIISIFVSKSKNV